MIPGFSTRLGWERRWKSFMANSKDWRSENVNAPELNCKVVKKVATPPLPPPFVHQRPLFRSISPFKQKISYPPQVTQFLEGPTPQPPWGGGGSNYEHPLVIFQVAANFLINQQQNIFAQGTLYSFFIPKRKLRSPSQNHSFYHISYYF